MTKKDFNNLILQSTKAKFDDYALMKAREIAQNCDELELEEIAIYLNLRSKNAYYGLRDLMEALAQVKKDKITILVKKSKVKNAVLPKFQNDMLLFGYFLEREIKDYPDYLKQILREKIEFQ